MAEKSFRVFSRIVDMTDRSELAETLSEEVRQFSIADLQAISARLEKEIGDLPSPYREKIRPCFMEQYFGRYYRIVNMQNSGELRNLNGSIRDKELFRSYCNMLLSRYQNPDIEDDEELTDAPFNSLFYYLISAFYMFVMDEPGHPTGTPFPGGFKVERRDDGVVYCPIRDKEKDVEYSICNFCPAKQDDMP